MIIENYIDWYTSDENERIKMKDNAYEYVEGDWVNELENFELTKNEK